MIANWLGDRAFWRGALKLALPIALQNLLLSSFSLVDTIMIGSLGEIPLAAVGMAGQWSWLMNIVLFGFASGATVFVAQFWGVKDIHGIRSTFGIVLVNTSLAALLFFAVAQIAPRAVLRIFTPDEAVIAQGVDYLRYASFSYLAVALSQSFNTLLRSTEQPKLPMYGSGVAVLLNIVFNALFIYGLQMGVKGAAIATALSSWVSPVIVYLVSKRKKNLLVSPIKTLFGWDFAFFKRFMARSMPVLVNETIWSLGTVIYNALYSNLDTQFYAALTIFKSVEGMCFVFFVGLCHACAVMVGKRVGQGELKGATTDARRFAVAITALSVVVGVALVALRPVIMRAFSVSSETAFAANRIMLFYGLELWLRNIPYIMIVGIFRAGGDTKTGLLYDLVFLWGVSLPLTFISALVLKMPLTWVYLVMLLAEDVGKVFFCLRRFFSRKWLMPVTTAGQQALAKEG